MYANASKSDFTFNDAPYKQMSKVGQSRLSSQVSPGLGIEGIEDYGNLFNVVHEPGPEI